MKHVSRRGNWNAGLVSATVAALIAGCGEISVKRGATPEEFMQARRFCEQNEGVFASVSACLEDQGWTIVGGAADDAQAAPLAAEPPLPGSEQDAQAAAESDAAAITFGTTDRRLGLFPIKEETVSDPRTPSEAAAPSAAQPRTVDPMAEVRVNSWWKVGADGEALRRDGNLCLMALGEGYSASGNFSRLSYGVLQCLKTGGWRYQMAK